MKVMDILEKKSTQVITIQDDATIHDALGLLVQHRIGAIIVVDNNTKVCGIISERDIIRECYHSTDHIQKKPINQIMTKNLIIGAPDDDIDYIMGIITNNHIRHVPIIRDNDLCGIVSIGDIVKAQLHNTKYENHYLKDYIFGPHLPDEGTQASEKP
ncbi:MAG: CBS domain-containing protein [Chlamydiota bacterium]|nr:CBS domain-containing protein [Chlamydiota bacterium]